MFEQLRKCMVECGPDPHCLMKCIPLIPSAEDIKAEVQEAIGEKEEEAKKKIESIAKWLLPLALIGGFLTVKKK